jgi:hypothetical protein
MAAGTGPRRPMGLASAAGLHDSYLINAWLAFDP